MHSPDYRLRPEATVHAEAYPGCVESQRSWPQYQEWVAQWAQQVAGDEAVVEYDVRLVGRRSGVDRQIDALVTGSFAGELIGPATAVVDAKLSKRNLTVRHVHELAGLIDDVGADFGVLVTNNGYSKAAKRVASDQRIRLHV
jgi:hypothetical protein